MGSACELSVKQPAIEYHGGIDHDQCIWMYSTLVEKSICGTVKFLATNITTSILRCLGRCIVALRVATMNNNEE